MFTTMLLGLPMLGIILSNKEITTYLEFPPLTSYVKHAPFSWPVFLGYTIFVLAVVSPFLMGVIRVRAGKRDTPSHAFPFPWWGGFGILLGLVAWILAWSRFDWFFRFQPHTFTPLWLAYIITINALTYHRTGHCMMRDRPHAFFLLFPVSAAFWWFFEYLNRFVQNWYYVGAQFGPWEYFWYATLPFSTVLPAVMATQDWLLSFSWPRRKFQNSLSIKFNRPKRLAWAILFITGAGLGGIGVWPNHLFPLLWISPLLIIVSLQSVFGDGHIFSRVPHGDWHLVFTASLAALICGFFWEMWNYYSLAKWSYSIPFVHRYQVFEMPILGYAGYLPFGLECAVIAHIFTGKEGLCCPK
ncbi:MAG: hypothetical protein JSW56_08385 [Deltaproteobacteria bacterium]|nr:MAG: hypothetical protein JSW56_08385 [Deltaproteobacteria bacterium]